LARMPAVDLSARSTAVEVDAGPSNTGSPATAPKSLLEDWDDAPPSAPTPVAAAAPTAAAPGGLDLMSELFGGSSPAASAPSPAPTPTAAVGGGLDALFGAGPPPSNLPSRSPATFVAYSKNGIQITFTVLVNPAQPGMYLVTAAFTSAIHFPVLNFDFKVAVPKYVKLQVSPPTSATLQTGVPVTQQLRLLNSEHATKPLLLKLRLIIL